MKRALFASAAVLLAVSPAAFAQTKPADAKPIVAGAGLSPDMTDSTPKTTTTATATPAPAAVNAPNTNGMGQGSPAEAAVAATGSASGVGAAGSTDATPAKTATGADLTKDLTADLTKAGFSDVNVMPGSFIVHANDKAGHPVTLFLSPDSVTMVSSTDETDGTAPTPPAATGGKSADATAQKSEAAGGIFTSIRPKDDLSSSVVGLDIYNGAKQDIGTIKDIAFGAHGVRAYIVGVGGFLGVGDHYVAVRPSAITLSYNVTDKKWHAEMDTDAARLKAAPEYKYPANS
jgi:hypothetical protein